MARATALLALRHGLPYHSVPTALLLTDKVLQRAALNAADVTPVRFETVGTAAEVPSALARIGFPAIVKPRYGQSSANTIRCDSDAAIAVSLDGEGGWTIEELLPGQAHPQGTWLAHYCSVGRPRGLVSRGTSRSATSCRWQSPSAKGQHYAERLAR